MQTKKILLVYIIAFIAISSVYPISGESLEPNNPPHWNDGWLYKQEINMPISTEDPFSIYQPIDIEVEFKDPCWAKDSNNHSIRVLCWSGERWHELESQIYDLVESEPRRISRCGLVFLVPEIADGNERYFVYYDKNEKSNPNYVNHVDIEDSYYYFEPIKGVAAEGDYYKIIEDGFVTYGVGQKGNAINRPLSQIVIKQKPETKEFSLMDSDNSASFAFSYHVGVEDEDEISSDQKLLSKDVLIDGNLMLEFKITSESNDKTIRTTNFYKYYYCPTDTKRISVHVNHQILEDLKVKGIEDIDGRYGAIVSFRSTSEKIEKMRFGDILPYIHVSGEQGGIREYNMILDPEDKNREWPISYLDDCDLGEGAWLSYDEGKTGKAQAIIFSSNKNIINTNLKDERDGIQVKVAEKEYLDVIGAEIDYASISLGRNSYEKNSDHDINIPGNLDIEFFAEFFTSNKGGYEEVIKEADYFKKLVNYRRYNEDSGSGDQDIYTLTVNTRLTGRFLSDPFFSKFIGSNLTYIYGELYQNDKLISTADAQKPIIGAPKIKFPKLAKG